MGLQNIMSADKELLYFVPPRPLIRDDYLIYWFSRNDTLSDLHLGYENY